MVFLLLISFNMHDYIFNWAHNWHNPVDGLWIKFAFHKPGHRVSPFNKDGEESPDSIGQRTT